VIKESADLSPFRLPWKVETGVALSRKDDRKQVHVVRFVPTPCCNAHSTLSVAGRCKAIPRCDLTRCHLSARSGDTTSAKWARECRPGLFPAQSHALRLQASHPPLYTPCWEKNSLLSEILCFTPSFAVTLALETCSLARGRACSAPYDQTPTLEAVTEKSRTCSKLNPGHHRKTLSGPGLWTTNHSLLHRWPA